MTKAELKALDRQLANWEATKVEHDREMIRRDEQRRRNPDAIDRFDVASYQRMIYGNKWNQ